MERLHGCGARLADQQGLTRKAGRRLSFEETRSAAPFAGRVLAPGGVVLRKLLGLGAVVLCFVGPPACLNNEGPDRFTTTRCYEGDIQGCLCGNSPTGIQFCDSSGKFSGRCRCEGCSAFPDCT